MLVTSALAYLAVVIVPLPDRLTATDSKVVEYRDGTSAHVFLSSDDKWRVSVVADDVDPEFLSALIRLEDKRFYGHPGVDFAAIARAIAQNAAGGRRVSGASTITMQVVRLLEPRPRTYFSKVIEMMRAFQLEALYSKDQILSLYLRFAPYGRNIEGIEAASMAYFGHRASALSPAEIATLLAVPQAPNARYPHAEHVERLENARNDIARRLLDEGKMPRGKGDGELTADQVHDLIVGAWVPDRLRPFPRDMPHVAQWAVRKMPDHPRIRTTIDLGIQQTTEEALARHYDEAKAREIEHATVVVADHRTHEIRALVGNFTYDATAGSQIAAFDVVRSPGSLLKPFIYALGIERGLVHPDYMVEDLPTRMGTYAPQNYDGRFNGLVRLDEALSRSLNVPFVRLLQQIGVQSFLSALTSMGAKQLRPEPGYYGLTAAIGGVDITPLEVAEMYATLASDGQYTPLRWETTRTEQPWKPWKVFGPGAAWLTRKTLSIKDRPDFSARRRMNPNAGQVHWKTGTSFGNKDAWAAGSGEHFTAVVWMGNLDNQRSSGLVGARRSGPVLFDVLEGIEFSDQTRPGRPDELIQVNVCAYSGHLPAAACEHTKAVWVPERAVPVAKCPYHQHVQVDVSSGLAVGPKCQHGRHTELKSFVVWPASVKRFLNDQNRGVLEPPAWAEGCKPFTTSKPPSNVSPEQGQYVMRPGILATDQEIPLMAETSDSSQSLSWFVDGTYLKSAPAHERVWWTPAPGSHEIVVMDESGRSTRRQLQITAPTARVVPQSPNATPP